MCTLWIWINSMEVWKIQKKKLSYKKIKCGGVQFNWILKCGSYETIGFFLFFISFFAVGRFFHHVFFRLHSLSAKSIVCVPFQPNHQQCMWSSIIIYVCPFNQSRFPLFFPLYMLPFFHPLFTLFMNIIFLYCIPLRLPFVISNLFVRF